MVKLKRTVDDWIFDICNYAFFMLFTRTCIIPFYYLSVQTTSDNSLTSRGLATLIPKGIHFTNYIEVFEISGISQAAFISVARTTLGRFFTFICTSYMGYFLPKREMWSQKFWYRFVVITMCFSAGMIPSYLNIRNLALLNNFLVYIIPGLVGTYNLSRYKTHVENCIPESLEESAEVDGAGCLTRYLRIVRLSYRQRPYPSYRWHEA